MRKLTIVALIVALTVPAVAVAAVDKFTGKGIGHRGKRVDVSFKVRNNDRVFGFQAERVKFKCDNGGDFRADPPKFSRKVNIRRNREFRDKYTKKSGRRKLKGKVNGNLFGPRRRFNRADGDMKFISNFTRDDVRCVTNKIEWKARD